MAAKEHKNGFWTRALITSIVIIWVGVLLGHWVGHTVLETKLEKDNVSTETGLPTKASKPWVEKPTDLQAELDKANSAADSDTEMATAEEQTETEVLNPAAGQEAAEDVQPAPEEEASQAADVQSLKGSTANKGQAGDGDTPEPTPALQPSEYVLQFGVYADRKHAEATVERLKAKGVDGTCLEQDSAKGTVYIVRALSFTDVDQARAKMAEMKNAGFEVYVLSL